MVWSRDDWDVESAKMASIYEDSYLTVAAGFPSGDNQGFLGLEQDNREHYISKQVAELDNTYMRKVHDYRSISTEDILVTRAWTMQEKILPQRLLTFSLGISFHCRQSDWCECGSGPFPDLLATDPDPWRRLDRALSRVALDGESDSSKIHNFWLQSIVVPYSRRKLTRSSDRLPAISALAQKFQLKLDEQYLAGIWEQDLICSFNWNFCARAEMAGKRSEVYMKIAIGI